MRQGEGSLHNDGMLSHCSQRIRVLKFPQSVNLEKRTQAFNCTCLCLNIIKGFRHVSEASPLCQNSLTSCGLFYCNFCHWDKYLVLKRNHCWYCEKVLRTDFANKRNCRSWPRGQSVAIVNQTHCIFVQHASKPSLQRTISIYSPNKTKGHLLWKLGSI